MFTPVALGSLQLRNRIVMAPMTRSRAGSDAVPTAVMVEYYRQRASAGLIISEGIAPSASASCSRVEGLASSALGDAAEVSSCAGGSSARGSRAPAPSASEVRAVPAVPGWGACPRSPGSPEPSEPEQDTARAARQAAVQPSRVAERWSRNGSLVLITREHTGPNRPSVSAFRHRPSRAHRHRRLLLYSPARLAQTTRVRPGPSPHQGAASTEIDPPSKPPRARFGGIRPSAGARQNGA